ncbi:hypothetical protein AYR54_11145 [Loigolactobacillus backii]|uniref:Uncharacterized protein n=1 Tax=Loigolactobacillus backii TaxID=375175 RepID=A0A192H026_9LACO|nr:hypothetical protein AYR52_11350 [Loigolactobacillus backii]ANK61633.1 hypothetical protein AYR53_01965 [Loigolactobacillus backii]ANK65749.1 hypothetical protein AYR54_11145 [Loigolactobacillus backii]ANK68225.1 hypothetical protein AYR55_11295 [Loigolactobacillus backii]ANK69167.1 hypothetical protein AYR56_02745 [Loigolactobacillus backii]
MFKLNYIAIKNNAAWPLNYTWANLARFHSGAGVWNAWRVDKLIFFPIKPIRKRKWILSITQGTK